MTQGALIEYRLALHRVPVSWLTRIETWEPGRRFVDVRVKGPYRLWHHSHGLSPRMRTLVRDGPLCAATGPLGRLAHAGFVRRDLERIFDFRQERVAHRLGGGRAEPKAPPLVK